jgi:hypothetical protein
MRLMLSAQITYNNLTRISDLQRRILQLVTEHPEVDYDFLATETNSDRPTLVDSTLSLRNKGLILSVRVDKKNPKSRLTFIPTEKGMCLSILHLSDDPNGSYDRFIRSHGYYFEQKFSQIIPNKAYQKTLFFPIAEYLLANNLFTKDGQARITNKDEKIRVYMEIAKVVKDTFQIKEDVIDDLQKIVSKEMLKMIRDYYIEVDKNLHKHLEKFKELEKKGLV